MILTLAQAASTAISVGLGCGTCCGTSASAFLSAYILSEGSGLKIAAKHAAGFLFGKMLSVSVLCAVASALGASLIGEDGRIGDFDLRTAVYWVQLAAALWLIVRWFSARRGCQACKTCGRDHHFSRVLPTFGVGLAYGVTPCAPLLLIAGYAIALSLQAAIVLGAFFALSSSLVPILFAAGLSGLLSAKISEQLGKALPWFQLAVYLAFLVMAIIGLVW